MSPPTPNRRIEQYALIGDTETAALVGDDGSIDWFCAPRFDSGACFAALVGDPGHGRWLIGPSSGVVASRRRYHEGTLVLETEFETPEGSVRVTDCMPERNRGVDIVRLVEGVRGAVPMSMELIARFDYGAIIPWVRAVDGTVRMIAGPDALRLVTPVPTEGHDFRHVSSFTVRAGDRVPFSLTWFPSFHGTPPAPPDVERAIAATAERWEEWTASSECAGEWRDVSQRSLITLKALTYAPTGGIVAAPTTSLPEWPGGVRNWDYRYCWLRDSTFTLYALMVSGYRTEAKAWREWLLRAVAGDPANLQTTYGVAGERRLTEWEVPWLPGFEGAAPVRIGNAASRQFQLDVYGEVMDSLHQARRLGMQDSADAWAVQRALLDFLEDGWREPDEGIWEVRGERQHFTHSKVMAWVAFDRAVRAVEESGLEGPADRWRAACDEVHDEVIERAFDGERMTFTQSYGSRELDASALMIPLVGFLPADDPRVVGTVAAIRRELVTDGFVARYSTASGVDGLPEGEGAFLACSFWLADNLALQGRQSEARALFERLLGLANDVGLLAEQYDPVAKRQLGNFPQAFTHVSLVNTAANIARGTRPAMERAGRD